MRIIAIANHKGGCGKTTTAINLSAGLARHNRKVLLIDMDPQAHSTIGLNVQPQKLEKTIYNVLLDSKVELDAIIRPISLNLDLAPADIILSGAELELAGAIGREKELSRCIARLNWDYNYVIIDSPPTLGLLTFNALVAADEALIPIESGFFGLHGVGKLLEVIQLIREKLGHPIRVRILSTMYDRRTNISKETFDELRKFFQEKVLKTVINTNVKLKEAVSKGAPIFNYDPNSAGSRDYEELAKEIISLEKKPKKTTENLNHRFH